MAKNLNMLPFFTIGGRFPCSDFRKIFMCNPAHFSEQAAVKKLLLQLLRGKIENILCNKTSLMKKKMLNNN